MSSFAVILGILVGVLLLIVLFLWHFQERIAFQPPRGPFPGDTALRRVEYSASDGQRLLGYIVGEPTRSRGLLIAFHGNADLAVRQAEWAAELHGRTGVAVLLAEYRGYMGLPGRPTYATTRLDADAAWSFAHDSIGISPDRMAVFGHSLGSAVATELAVRRPVAVLLLQSPFSSAQDMAALMLGRRPSNFSWRILSRLPYETASRVVALQVPVSVAHGMRDLLIPIRMGELVFEAAGNRGVWLAVPGASHNDVALQGGDAYWAWMRQALEPLGD